MQPLPIGIQTFKDLRNGNFLYIDKTKQIFSLIEAPKGAYFLSRPRRFGKSLTLSVLDEIFSGNRDLFRGLWIYDSPWEWKSYPVFRFDFSLQKAKNSHELIEFIQIQLKNVGKKFGITLETNQFYDQFAELIQKVAQKEKCVILIDEYDKPIIDHLEDIEKAKEMREVMKGFFTVLKGSDSYIRFLFLTGVSKFSKAGVFSNLNHLRDITLEDEYSSLVGITDWEMENYFKEYIDSLAQKENLDYSSTLKKIKDWYNGYCFSGNGVSVYNPFSTLLLFAQKFFEHHWFQTGTPEFLIKLIRKREYDIIKIPFRAETSAFSTYDVEDLNLTPLLLQTGYLTIKGYDSNLNVYTLDYPNYEVKQAFLSFLFRYSKKEETDSFVIRLYSAFQSNDLEEAMEILKEIFLSVEYDLHINQERYYQTIFYLIFTLLGFKIRAEVKTNRGRIDAVVETGTIYIFEFKLNGTKEEAMEQIKTKKYYEPYLSSGKPIILVGAEFRDRNLGEFLVEEWVG
jgi:hypothetical protein